jgi:Tol biopolymer transport system component
MGLRILLAGLASIWLLQSCSSGGSDSSSPQVSRVEIRETALLFTEPGANRVLKATAYDRFGTIVPDANIAWRSSKPESIAVDATGRVSAAVANGSAQIVAEAGGVASPALLVAVTRLPAEAVTLTDARILDGPSITDPDAAPSFLNTFQVVLGGEPPQVGALLINTESKPVVGRVVAVEPGTGQSQVTLEMVSLREAFPNLELRETFDLSQAPVEVNPEMASFFEITREGDTWVFSPRPQTNGQPEGKRVQAKAAQGTRALGPFQCAGTNTLDDGALPFKLSVPPAFSAKLNSRVEIVSTEANGLERFVLVGEPSFKLSAGVSIAVAFEAKYSCRGEFFNVRIPVSGPLSVFLSGLVPVGAALELGGKMTLASAGATTSIEGKVPVQIGIDCPPGESCSFVRSLSGSFSFTPSLDAPSLSDLRFEPSVGAFGTVDLAVGNVFIDALRFQAVKAQAGVALRGSFAPLAAQIDDTGYRSDYKATLEAKAGVGVNLDDFFKLVGLGSITPFELAVSTELGASPKMRSLTSDKPSFSIGERVNFEVRLDPATVNFPSGVGFYNVARVLLVRRGIVPEVVDEVTASDGQTDFRLSILASENGSLADYVAFVVTRLSGPTSIDAFALELAPSSGESSLIAYVVSGYLENELWVVNTDTQAKRLVFTASLLDPSGYVAYPTWSPDRSQIAFEMRRGLTVQPRIWVINADGSNLREITATAPPSQRFQEPAWSPDGTRIAASRSTSPCPGSDDDDTSERLIVLMTPDGDSITNLSPSQCGRFDRYPSWSPDSVQVAFVHEVETGNSYRNELRTIELAGRRETTLPVLGNFRAIRNPAWSRGGNRIAFDGIREGENSYYLMLHQIDTSETREVRAGSSLPGLSWSPDDRLLATSGLQIVNVQTGELLLSPASGFNPDWAR